MTEEFVAGLVGAPFGLKGFVKIRSLSGEWDYLTRLESVIIRRGAERRSYEIESVIPVSPGLAMKFGGVDTPEAAKALGGAEVLVDRAHAAPLGEGEFYIEDLRGMEVVLETGTVLGRITDILEGGGGFLAELRLLSGEFRFVPFRKEFFGDIAPDKSRAVLLKPWVLE
jgi:16S rRNA processing protein RimM